MTDFCLDDVCFMGGSNGSALWESMNNIFFYFFFVEEDDADDVEKFAQ